MLKFGDKVKLIAIPKYTYIYNIIDKNDPLKYFSDVYAGDVGIVVNSNAKTNNVEIIFENCSQTKLVDKTLLMPNGTKAQLQFLNNILELLDLNIHEK